MAFPSFDKVPDFMGGHVFPLCFGINRHENDLPRRDKVVINYPHASAFSGSGAAPAYLTHTACTRDDFPCFRVLREPKGKGFIFKLVPDGFCLFRESVVFDNRSRAFSVQVRTPLSPSREALIPGQEREGENATKPA